jgi:hypothetical protein
MNKRNKTVSKKNYEYFSKKRIIILAFIFTIGGLIVYGGINALKSSNGNFFSSPPRNIFLKALYSPNHGYSYTSQSTGTAKILNSGGGNSGVGTNHGPTLTLNQGRALAVHLINEDSETHSKHNLNIDELNVHTKDLGYFQSETVTFTANKSGIFDYYCSIHPEMTGKLVVDK